MPEEFKNAAIINKRPWSFSCHRLFCFWEKAQVGESHDQGYRIIPFGLCSNINWLQKLDECWLPGTRTIFATARKLGFFRKMRLSDLYEKLHCVESFSVNRQENQCLVSPSCSLLRRRPFGIVTQVICHCVTSPKISSLGRYTKLTKGRHFQFPPVFSSFSKSSVFVTDSCGSKLP